MYRLIKLYKKDILYLILLFLFSVGYFFRLFIPKESLFITPDVYSSDLVHINYSLKFVLSDFLKNNRFPFWDWNTGNGFPLIGESQIGAFYFLNIILFKLLPFNFAYNFGYILTFYISSLGCYLFFRRFARNKLIAFLSSLIFSYSAPMFVQISHYNLLQTYSLIPIIFYFLDIYLSSNSKNKKLFNFIIISLLLSQQFYAGYVMTSFMTILFIGIYVTLKLFIFKKVRLSVLLKNIFVLILGLGLSVSLLSINQLMPLLEFAHYSVRSNSGSYSSTANSLSPLIFLTYLKFDYFHAFDTVTKSLLSIIRFSSIRNIFWDGNLFIGIFPIISSITLSVIFFKKKLIRFFIILFITASLFALGQNSPLNFFYGFPPFSYFRTPFRFNIFMTFFMMLIFLISLNIFLKDNKKVKYFVIIKILIYILSIYTIINLATASFKYHKTVPLEKFNKNIKTGIESSNKNQNIYSFGNELIWYQTLLYKKWFDEDIYLFFMKDLSPYINENSKTSSSNIFFASFFAPRKQFYFDNFIRLSFIKELESKNISFSFDPVQNYQKFLQSMYIASYNLPIEAINSLRIKGVKYFVTPLNLKESKNYKKINEISRQYNNQYYYLRTYEIFNSYPKVYLTNDYAYINTVNDAISILSTKKNDIPTFGYADIDIKKTSAIKSKVDNYFLHDNSINFDVETDTPSLLVTTGSNFPGIKVYVNGINTKVEEVNFNQIAFKIRKGKHRVIITYKPDWLTSTVIISLITHLISLLGIGIFIFRKTNKSID